MVLQASLNGSRSQGVPVTPGEIAAAGLAACQAGASALHIHARDDDGKETVSPDPVARLMKQLRIALPASVTISISTGMWIGGPTRIGLVDTWTVLPNECSVNLSEPDAAVLLSVLGRKGIAAEIGLWSPQDAMTWHNLQKLGPLSARIARLVIQLSPFGGRVEYQAIRDMIGPTEFPVMLHGEDESAWHALRLAGSQGHQTRIGLEHVAHLPDGRPATDNAELIAAAVHILGRIGRAP